MKRILISILSDYLQPNFLLIKEFEGKYDKLVFITTEEMEGETKRKSLVLEKVLNLPANSVQRIPVIEDDYLDVKQKLEDCSFSKEDQYILNITGGTKVIPIAVCDFFKDYTSVFYYVPNGKNLIRNVFTDETISLQYRLNLQEYFTLNGLHLEPDPDFLCPESMSRMLFNEFEQVCFDRRKHKKIACAQELPTATEKKYYGGAWFEEYCYYRLKKEMNLSDEAIGKNAKITRLFKESDKSKNITENKQNDNEADVIFIHDNLLYIFECKVSMFGNMAGVSGDISEKPKATIEKYMYKLAAIAKDYGFRPKSYILTLQNVKNSRLFNSYYLNNLKNRMGVLGIADLLDCNDIADKSPLLGRIKGASKEKPALKVELRHPMIETETPKIELKIVGKIDLDNIKKK